MSKENLDKKVIQEIKDCEGCTIEDCNDCNYKYYEELAEIRKKMEEAESKRLQEIEQKEFGYSNFKIRIYPFKKVLSFIFFALALWNAILIVILFTISISVIEISLPEIMIFLIIAYFSFIILCLLCQIIIYLRNRRET